MKKTIYEIIKILIVPLTILIGYIFLENRKYYIVSLLIIIESIIISIYNFEKKKLKLSEIVILAIISAIAVIGRIAFYMVPQVKPMVAIVILAGIALRKRKRLFSRKYISLCIKHIYRSRTMDTMANVWSRNSWIFSRIDF